jgi:hypothetical protein
VPLTPKQEVKVAKAIELASIPDSDMLTREQTARLLGISIASLDRYARRCDPIGGVVLQPANVGERAVRYKAIDVKAVRAGFDEKARRWKEAKLADKERYGLKRV